ncbi:hypothetical protein PAXINDRAFT_19792 [Paxillus involutus ATCC 200175]|uniref:DUF6533 domain-containing protein n=1 Tax=Paxillus involutus ATCC 200175 TaxID=664439 RepID=A0A0C9TI70_PAXIN|nr:hypothetical protein PAXINDRAFT_19792 [Paxillus involutus ATCC 200175]
MSSEIQSVVASLQLNDYIAAVMTTAVGYDYLLTFSREVEYVWKRPWSWVSTLFIVVRYMGCLSAMVQSFFGSTFATGPLTKYVFTHSLNVFDL